MTMDSAVRLVHGSVDSRDVDVVYLVCNELPSNAAFAAFCANHAVEDVNVALVADGSIRDCMRGLPCECAAMCASVGF